MQISFRSDASHEIGRGHIMRCLTLAHRLRERGAACHFITRSLKGHLANKITNEGFTVSLLPLVSGSNTNPLPKHVESIRPDWFQDAQETCAVLDDEQHDWLVLDHYGYDARWQTMVRSKVKRLMVIDDLANRSHTCDLLLDQNLGRRSSDYDTLVPEAATRLIGPNFALLRPDFLQTRNESLARRIEPKLRHILITMGGSDPENATGQAFDVLAKSGLANDLLVTAALGSSAPNGSKVHAQTKGLPFSARLLTDVTEMAQLMANADLAIGAAGGTAWERCCLGLPTFLVVLAANQHLGAQALAKTGAVRLLGEINDGNWQSRLREALHVSTSSLALKGMSEKALSITDGRGSDRVAAKLLETIA